MGKEIYGTEGRSGIPVGQHGHVTEVLEAHHSHSLSVLVKKTIRSRGHRPLLRSERAYMGHWNLRPYTPFYVKHGEIPQSR